MKMKTCLIQREGCAPARMPMLASFTRDIQGEVHAFAVTPNTQGAGHVLTHVASGMKVCALGVGATYLPGYAKLKAADYKAKGEMALDELIARVGVAKVRTVLAAAPELQP